MQPETIFDPRMWGWQQRAACRGEDSALFFAPNYFEKKREKDAREARAKAYCIQCPVRERCLEYALKIREEHGIWGGLNEQERRQLLRRRAADRLERSDRRDEPGHRTAV